MDKRINFMMDAATVAALDAYVKAQRKLRKLPRLSRADVIREGVLTVIQQVQAKK